MDARRGARLLAGGRVAIGFGLLVAPKLTAGRWLGPLAQRPGVQAVVRSLGVRDMVLGLIALHTVENPQVGPRWVATCAVVDLVDALATGAAASDLPAAGVAGTVALAGGAAVAGGYFARALRDA